MFKQISQPRQPRPSPILFVTLSHILRETTTQNSAKTFMTNIFPLCQFVSAHDFSLPVINSEASGDLAHDDLATGDQLKSTTKAPAFDVQRGTGKRPRMAKHDVDPRDGNGIYPNGSGRPDPPWQGVEASSFARVCTLKVLVFEGADP